MRLAQAFGIQSIPTVILFKDGKPVKQSIGYWFCIKREVRENVEIMREEF